MIDSLFVESLQFPLSVIRKVTRNVTITLLLFSVLIPISQSLNIQAQNAETINLNTKVLVEIVKKDSTWETKTMTLQELQSDKELANIGQLQFDAAQAKLNLTSGKIQAIESIGGVFYQDQVAITDLLVLASLGYNPEQIAVIQKMVDFYNSQTITSVNLKLETQKTGSLIPFTVQAQAQPCQREIKHDSQHWWGNRYFINDCMVDHLENIEDAAGIASIIAGLVGCNVFCGVIALYIYLHTWEMKRINQQCGENGVFMDIHWSLDIAFTPIC